VLASVAVAAVVAAGCGGDDDEGGGSAEGGSGETLTVWNNEFQPDRMAATQEIPTSSPRRPASRPSRSPCRRTSWRR
jgi:hypothetical protein